MPEYETLRVEEDEDAYRIVIDTPNRLNATGWTAHKELSQVFEQADTSPARSVVLTGCAGTFSAGGDIEWMKEHLEMDPRAENALLREYFHDGEKMLRDMIGLRKPLVARLNGDAIGLGATLALFCDIVVAVDTARIGDPHVKLGLPAGDGGAVIWPLLTDIHTAKEMLMTGRILDAQTAHDRGLINHVVPHDELDATVDGFISEFATGSALAIWYTRLAINKWLEFWLDEIFRESFALEMMTVRAGDHEVAVDAFLRDEAPTFSDLSD